MIDWNNNGKIDPEEIFLTEEILGEDNIPDELISRMDAISPPAVSLLYSSFHFS